MNPAPIDGGPAFPSSEYFDGAPLNVWRGLSIRDYFAAAIAGGLLAATGRGEPLELARFTYRLADAMLLARAEPAGEIAAADVTNET